MVVEMTDVGDISGPCSQGCPEAGPIGHISEVGVRRVDIVLCELVDLFLSGVDCGIHDKELPEVDAVVIGKRLGHLGVTWY